MLFRDERIVKPIRLPCENIRLAFSVFATVLNGDLRTRFVLIAKGFLLVAILLHAFIS